MNPFSERVIAGLERRGLTMRQLCRAVALDPSFFSKVLSGKRSPPMEEEVLRRIAAELELDAAELIVAAGRIPSEWAGVWKDRELFARVNAAAVRKSFSGVTAVVKKPPEREKPAEPSFPRIIPKKPGLSEELL